MRTLLGALSTRLMYIIMTGYWSCAKVDLPGREKKITVYTSYKEHLLIHKKNSH